MIYFWNDLLILSQMNLLMERPFQTFDLPHNMAMLLTLIIAIAVTGYARSGADERRLVKVRFIMGSLLLIAVALDPILTLVRYGLTDQGWELLLDNSLPFYLCDVVSIFLAFALFTKSQRLAEIGYLWGIAGTLQGLLMPTLWFDWREIEFYIFFLQHGGAPIAAVFLVWGLGILPEKGAFRRSVYWSLGYIAVVMSINWAIGENYGFLNGKPAVGTFFDYMGPWPFYLITLQLIAYSLYLILLRIAPKTQESPHS
jgi:hypothetical integral membrane protein (TIGR02206 family)